MVRWAGLEGLVKVQGFRAVSVPRGEMFASAQVAQAPEKRAILFVRTNTKITTRERPVRAYAVLC